MVQQNSVLRVKELCKEKGISLRELATRMEVAPEALTRAISPGSNPTLNTLLNAAKALKVNIDELFVGSEEKVPINGFVEVDGTIVKVKSVDDIQKILKLISSVNQES